jgi:hypothetical protein
MKTTIDFYKRFSGAFRDLNDKIIWWYYWPNLMKIIIQKEGEMGKTYNIPPTWSDCTEIEANKIAKNFIIEKNISKVFP